MLAELGVVGKEFIILTISGVVAIWLAAALHLDYRRRKKKIKKRTGPYTRDLFL